MPLQDAPVYSCHIGAMVLDWQIRSATVRHTGFSDSLELSVGVDL